MIRTGQAGAGLTLPLPAGEERVFPRPVRADLQDSLADVPGEPMPGAVAECVQTGVPQAAAIMEAQKAGPAARSAAMFAAMTQQQLTCQNFEVPQSHGLGGPARRRSRRRRARDG
jgi:hypothetical protein